VSYSKGLDLQEGHSRAGILCGKVSINLSAVDLFSETYEGQHPPEIVI
jgi:hypothetical protein